MCSEQNVLLSPFYILRVLDGYSVIAYYHEPDSLKAAWINFYNSGNEMCKFWTLAW